MECKLIKSYIIYLTLKMVFFMTLKKKIKTIINNAIPKLKSKKSMNKVDIETLIKS